MTFELHLDSEPIARVSAQEPICVPPQTSIRAVIEVMRQRHAGSVLVCDGKQLCGILTERDVLRLMARGENFDDSVEQHMTPDPVSVVDRDTVGKAIQLMAGGGYRRIPVTDDAGTPKSVLEAADVLHYLVEHFPQFIYNLPPKPHHATQEREGA